MTSDSIIKTTDYCGNLIYEQGRPKMLLVDGGYVTFNTNDSLSYGEGWGGACYHYYLKDHLGNVRVVFNDQDSIEQVNDYYAFGGIMETSWGGDTQRYKYNGKELETVHGLDWYDYGARWMSPVLGRFTTPDPKQWDTPQVSSFAYCDNNPIKFIDPDGRKKHNWIKGTDRNRTNIDNFNDNPDVINIWAHGIQASSTSQSYGLEIMVPINDKDNIRIGPIVENVTTAAQFSKVLEDGSSEWREGKEDLKIVLHSCSAADLAKKFSNDPAFKDVTIIAANHNVVISSDKKKEYVKDHKITKRQEKNGKVVSQKIIKGEWVAFKNGKEIKRYSGNMQPGTKGFKY